MMRGTMRRLPPARSTPVTVGLAVAVAWGVLGVPTATFGQEPGADSPPVACTAEVEPNELPEQAPSLVGEICQTGTLPAQIPADQDLILWEVLPEDGLTTWSFTVRGVPTTITSIHVIPITSPPGVLPLEIASEVLRVDSDALLDTPPGVAEIPHRARSLCPGHQPWPAVPARPDRRHRLRGEHRAHRRAAADRRRRAQRRPHDGHRRLRRVRAQR